MAVDVSEPMTGQYVCRAGATALPAASVTMPARHQDSIVSTGPGRHSLGIVVRRAAPHLKPARLPNSAALGMYVGTIPGVSMACVNSVANGMSDAARAGAVQQESSWNAKAADRESVFRRAARQVWTAVSLALSSAHGGALAWTVLFAKLSLSASPAAPKAKLAVKAETAATQASAVILFAGALTAAASTSLVAVFLRRLAKFLLPALWASPAGTAVPVFLAAARTSLVAQLVLLV